MLALRDEYQLAGCFRWLPKQTNEVFNGELYRFVADSRGAFVQPATYEAFGLTVIEAMTSGLPVFVTNKGGPTEIIVHGESGFHIDPYHGSQAAEIMSDFFQQDSGHHHYHHHHHSTAEKVVVEEENGTEWDRISRGAIARVKLKYSWSKYSDTLLTLQNIYSFWRHATSLARRDTRRYLEMLYALKLRPLIQSMKN